MSVRKKIPYSSGMFFITFTCADWMPLFKLTNSYDLVYNWFNHMQLKGHYINAYVIMPDHVHAIISFTHTHKNINNIIGDGKRFMTYALIERLFEQKYDAILEQLSLFVNETDKKKGKKHEAFEPSFDWKHCYSDDFIAQKLDYIHMNPCRTNPPLALTPTDYIHSSANFYLGGTNIIYPVVHVVKMKDINLESNDGF